MTAVDRTHGFPLPPGGQANPSDWAPSDLMYYGLPQRPDRTILPAAYDAWMAMFGQTLRFLEYVGKNMEPEVISTDVDVPTSSAGPLIPFSPGHFGTSANWSGAYLDATSGLTFQQIYGQWPVPEISLPADDTDKTYQCANWIGFDGQRRYKSSTLPQLGSLQKVDSERDKTPSVCAWTQWWARNDLEATPVEICSFPVEFNNRLAGVVTRMNDHAVLCNLINLSTDPPCMVAVHVDAPPLPVNSPGNLTAPPLYTMAGATAEWVLERPAVLGHTDELQGFPDYKATAFASCVAVEGNDDGERIIERTLTTARYIRMFERREAPTRTVFISVPERDTDHSFKLHHDDI
ncbi:MAG: G1 family glutamic endopeptidase [Rhodopila sp.]